MSNKQNKFEAIVDSYFNGQFSQLKEQFKKLKKEERKDCIRYAQNYDFKEVAEYLFNLL